MPVNRLQVGRYGRVCRTRRVPILRGGFHRHLHALRKAEDPYNIPNQISLEYLIGEQEKDAFFKSVRNSLDRREK